MGGGDRKSEEDDEKRTGEETGRTASEGERARRKQTASMGVARDARGRMSTRNKAWNAIEKAFKKCGPEQCFLRYKKTIKGIPLLRDIFISCAPSRAGW
jgi:hypothetical protein